MGWSYHFITGGIMVSDGPKRDLKGRTKDYALRIIRLYRALPKETVAQVLGRQGLRSGTSVGAHYREASRARSPAEFVSKLNGGLQELDETAYWLELLTESETLPQRKTSALYGETQELISIFVTSINTTKTGRRRS